MQAFRPRRPRPLPAALVGAALSAAAAFAAAQPVPAALTPPMKSDVRLGGSVLATLSVESPAQCLAECRRVGGCSGFNFALAPVGGTLDRGAKPLPGIPGNRLPNCTLLSGALTDTPQARVASCRMPCDGAPAAPGTRPLPDIAQRTPPVLRLPPGGLPTPVPPPSNDGRSSDGKTPVAPPPSPNPNPPKPGTATPTAPGTPVTGTLTPLTPVVPPLQLARSGVRGWEVVTGTPVQVASLSSANAVAQCPQGKVAISAGYLIGVPVPDASYGVEVRGALPEGSSARVFLRNANLGHAVTLRAQAVCITPMPGLRAVEIGRQQIGDSALRLETACQPNERVIGGGAMASIDALLPANAPAARSDGGATWRSIARKASPLAAWQELSQARVLCAPEHLVDGWELVTAPDALLGARARADMEVRCSPGARVLAAGLQHLPGSDAIVFTTGSGDFGTPAAQAAEDGLSTQLQAAGGTSAIATVVDRNTVGAANSLRMRLTAVCARPA